MKSFGRTFEIRGSHTVLVYTIILTKIPNLYHANKNGAVWGLWVLHGHISDAYPSCSISWFLAPIGDQAFNISFCCICHSDEVVGGLFRFFGDERDCRYLLVSEGVCFVVSCNIDGVYS